MGKGRRLVWKDFVHNVRARKTWQESRGCTHINVKNFREEGRDNAKKDVHPPDIPINGAENFQRGGLDPFSSTTGMTGFMNS